MPLYGGNRVYHDWTYLLSELKLLQYDQALGNIFVVFGLVLFVIALIVPLLMKEYKKANWGIDIR